MIRTLPITLWAFVWVFVSASTTAPHANAASEVLDQSGLLAKHNELRARHGVPALIWSQTLQAEAQAWADRCTFEHSTTENGENLAWWWGARYTQLGQVQSWYDEIKDYDFAKGAARNAQVTGHFTQIIWRGTTAVGCGVKTCTDGNILVCQYSTPGNVRGQYTDNVPPLQ